MEENKINNQSSNIDILGIQNHEINQENQSQNKQENKYSNLGIYFIVIGIILFVIGISFIRIGGPLLAGTFVGPCLIFLGFIYGIIYKTNINQNESIKS